MKQNLRFAALAVLVSIALLGFWHLTQRKPDPTIESAASERPTSKTTATSAATPPRAPLPDANATQSIPKTDDQTIPAPQAPVQQSKPKTISPKPAGKGNIEGHVFVNGEPAAGYRVVGVFGPDDRSAESDATGKYEFKDVPVGTALLSLRKPNGNFDSASRSVEVLRSTTTELDFVMSAGTSTLTGTVTLEGKPLPTTQLSLVVEVNGSGGFPELGMTNNDGVYRFEAVPAGTALVKLIRNTGRYEEPIYEAELTENNTTNLDIEIAAAAKVGGKVSGIPEGWQLMGALVRGDVPMPQPDVQTLMSVIQDRMVIGGTMSDDGFYELEGIPPGKYTAIVYATPRNPEEKGFVQAGGEVTVEEGAQSVSLDLTLE